MSAKILIVEDEKSLAEAYKLILEKHKYAVALAFNGQEALDAVHGDTPDVILLDINMPTMNGLEFLRHLEKMDNGEPAVIVFSNMDSQADIDEAYRLGAKRYILKAWASPQDLVKIVEEALDA